MVYNDPKGYVAGTQTSSTKKKEAGLPIDAFRDCLKSHAARLTNRLVGKGSLSEKLLLRQRKENLGIIKDCYIELQKKVLGLPTKEQARAWGDNT